MAKENSDKSGDPQRSSLRGKGTGRVTYEGLWKPDDPRYQKSSVVIGPGMRSAPRSRPVRLLVTEHPANGGLVFATEERARFVDQIHRAIALASTWRQLKAALPAGEYDRIARSIAELDGSRPRLDDEFSEDALPGYSEGDYPPWLQAEMEGVLPADIISRFGRQDSTTLNGPYVHIDPAHRQAILAELLARGIVAEEATELSFH
jgi:hypothetical protein